MDLISVVGLVVLIALYLIIIIVGIVAARKFPQDDGTTQSETSIVAGRKLNSAIGIFTMTATTVGGGYINGTAESIASQGLVWTLAPFGICLGLIFGGVLFAKPMRNQRYMTMLDPFQQRYGDTMVGLLYITALCGDIFWSASILAALGTSLSVIVNLNVSLSIMLSACVAVTYTLFGQMIAVAFTDIVQLVLITFGLLISVPFTLTHESVGNIFKNSDEWLGTLDTKFVAAWIDLAVAMTFGTIPWQAYFQRVLSVKSAKEAQILSVVGGCAAAILAVPPLLIGAVETSADWNSTTLGISPVARNESSLTLPYVLHYFTPPAVSVIGLGAISAAVMSSADSAVLGSSSMFTHNIYRNLLRKKASQVELLWTQRVSVLCVGTIATVMAIFVPTVYFLFIFAADIVFVIMLPQLICVVHLKNTNTYGAILGYVVGLVLRIGAGEAFLSLPAFIKYPFYDENDGQLFPFRTFAMLTSFVVIVFVSFVADILFRKNILPKYMDFFKCFNGQSLETEKGSFHMINRSDSCHSDDDVSHGASTVITTTSRENI